jgi:site-specific DNA-methyltransferase (adenine-specific)
MPGGKGHSKNKLVKVEEILTRGKSISDVWSIPIISSSSKERLGYPTQKPLAVLERIIESASKDGDTVLDPFSGCGTAISASHKLNRRWIGIDITQLSIALHKNRLKGMFGLEPNKDYDIIGEPQSFHDAQQLAQTDRYQFEYWALSLIEARPYGGKKKGSDKGIDGVITFTDDAKGNAKQVLVQVKSGHVNSGLIRDFRGTIERENNAVMGIFITLAKPSKNMETEALEAGYYVSPFTDQKHLKIQIYTIEELLDDKEPDLPVSASFSTFKKAQKAKKNDESQQGKLL